MCWIWLLLGSLGFLLRLMTLLVGLIASTNKCRARWERGTLMVLRVLPKLTQSGVGRQMGHLLCHCSLLQHHQDSQLPMWWLHFLHYDHQLQQPTISISSHKLHRITLSGSESWKLEADAPTNVLETLALLPLSLLCVNLSCLFVIYRTLRLIWETGGADLSVIWQLFCIQAIQDIWALTYLNRSRKRNHSWAILVNNSLFMIA